MTHFGNSDDDMNEDIEIVDEDGAAEGTDSALKAEIDELRKEKLYLLADFDNFRKQAIKERSDLVKYGNEGILREFLTVLDNLERATSTELNAETMASYKSGVDMIVTQLKKVFERFGVEEVDPKGQIFDPSVSEALSSESNPNFPANAITQVFKKAYKLKGKIIRPAQVVVNTGTAKEE